MQSNGYEILYSGKSDKGHVRDTNEDEFVVKKIWDNNHILAVVIDGVGGYEGGEVAAGMAKDYIVKYLEKNQDGDTLSLLKQAVIYANNMIFEARKRNEVLKSMGCVLTSVIVEPNTSSIYMAHVGDTRLYQFLNGSLVKLSHDHSMVGYMEEIGEISETEAMKHPQRNVISKDIGSSLLDFSSDYIETAYFPLFPNTTLLLCSDGLSDMLDSHIISSVLAESLTIKDKAQKLIDLTNKAGGRDNVTVALISCVSEESVINDSNANEISKKSDDKEQTTNNNQNTDMDSFFNRVLRKTKDSKFIKHSKILTGSATFALLLSIIFFVYQTIDSRRESEKIINNLVNVQNSITTKYIGIFPIYIPRINNLLEEALDSYTKDYTNKVDTVIIFQDFLCYGIKSDPAGFAQMNELLLHLSDLGCQIYIAYYRPNGRAFNTLIKETFLSTENYAKYQNDCHSYFELRNRLYDDFTRQLKNKKHECNNTLPPHYVDSLKKALFHQYFDGLFDMNKLKSLGVSERNIVETDSSVNKALTKRRDDVYLMDSLKSEEYFALTKNEDEDSFKKLMISYIDTIPQLYRSGNVASWTIRTNNMIQRMNRIKRNNLNKNYRDVSYFDFYNTYMDFSREMEKMYSMCNAENMHLIPLDDYLTMSCWMTSCEGKGKAIFAFPSKYATEEIGFESQDDAISDYIRTMLNGVLVSSVKN